MTSWHRFYRRKSEFWVQIWIQREDLHQKTLSLRSFTVAEAWFSKIKSKIGFWKSTVYTVSTVFIIGMIVSEAGFGFSVKIYPKKPSSWAILTRFWAILVLISIFSVWDFQVWTADLSFWQFERLLIELESILEQIMKAHAKPDHLEWNSGLISGP